MPGRTSRLVLVADDEPAVLKYVEIALQRAGYTVVTAGDGQEALARAQEHADVALVILDLTMPEMDGAEALREIRALRPELPVVLSSGYVSDEREMGLGDQRPSAFLQKPYRRAALLALVEELIG